uniref:collagen alpha-6(VI) chain-like n=1 Tax=Monopterus albus TaxID=43700 RepID=UPI0009B39205
MAKKMLRSTMNLHKLIRVGTKPTSHPKMKGRTGLLFSLIVAVYSYGINAQAPECENATVADIVFLVKGSSSISGENFQEIRSFLRSIIRALNIGPNKVRIGLAQYSNKPHQEFLLKDHTNSKSLLAAVEKIPHREEGRETDKAIDFLLKEYFTKEAGSRASQRVPQIVVVISDGESKDNVSLPARQLRQQGVIVYAIGVGEVNQKQLKSIANRPSERFVLTTASYQGLQTLTQGLLQTLCMSMEAQRQAIADRFADIFFLVDSGLTPEAFSKFKQQLVTLTSQLNVGASTYRVGLAQYGQDTKVEFHLNTFQTKREILSTVRSFLLSPQPDQPRKLGSALQYASDNFFTKEAGGRAEQGSPQFLVVVSGKDSDDRVSREELKLKSAGITVVRMFEDESVEEISKFREAVEGILDFSFTGKHLRLPSVAAPPHLELTVLKDFLITEEKETIPEECKWANVADIVFIVDQSGSIGDDNFQLVRSFLKSVVSSLNVSTTRVRIGIVTYNEAPTAQVFLDTFDDKADILQFINIIPYSGGGTKTGAALNFTREHIFSEERGSRKGIQKRHSVGIKDANKNELLKIASHPSTSHTFTVDSFTKLKPLKQNLQKTVCSNIRYEAITVQSSKTDIRQACVQKDEADIFFLMDDSGSITNPDFYDMKKFIIEFVSNFRIGPQYVRTGLVKYSDTPTLVFDVTAYSDKSTVQKAVENIMHAGGGTMTGAALSSMEQHLKRAKSTRGYVVPEYLIVITDGESTDPVKAPAKKLRDLGVIIYAIGVKDSNQTQLLEIAGDLKRTYFVRNFDALRSINSTIITDICSPDACTDVPHDLIFLTDSSETISDEDYQKMKDFMKSFISRSMVGQDDVHIGVMQFSSKTKLEFHLNNYHSKQEMLDTVEKMQQMKEGTRTGKAIREVSKYFDVANGGRHNLRQTLVVITDGKAQDDVKVPAETLRAKGVVIYAIGVAQAELSQLVEITGSLEQVFYKSGFDEIKELYSHLGLKLCEQDCKKTERADIIFLVDGSTSINETEFQSMQKFMMSVVNKSMVGKNLTNFGVILYSNEPKSVFSLNAYDSKQKVLQAIKNAMQPQGDTFTSKALTYSLQFFSAEHGGRKAFKVPQILMVITDGDATDYRDLKPSSDALRAKGVTVFSIGVKDAVREQLNTMAGGDTSKVFYVDDFKALETLYKNISSVLCNSTKPVCENEKADLVFLLDQSSSIDPDEHTIMKDFIAELAKSFEIDEQLVHIGLAQFSDNPHHEFYLSQYSKKEGVMEHIKKLEYQGGNTNIGKALDFIKDYFQPSRGGRSWVPKKLVVLTDGNSHDDVEDAADHIRDLGVEVFAIGVGDIHNLVLLQITGTPEKLFTVQNFKGLATIKEKVVNAFCPPPSQPPGCTIDIAIGFDISKITGVPGENLKKVLPEIVHYISSVQGLCCVGPAPIETKIAFQVVDDKGLSLYDTNFEGYNEDVLKKVINHSLSQPTYFNTALLNSFKDRFKTKSNAGVKVAVIFSDGLDEDVMKLEDESELLRQSGVSALLTVALEGAHNPAQLQMVEFGRGFGYKIPLSISMSNIGSTILKQIDSVSDRECCNVTCKCSGHEGPRGSSGSPGIKGSPGQKGQQGFPGEEGIIGERGHPGLVGPQGIHGCPGVRGPKGFRGITGDRGENGEDGLDGISGEQGVPGLDGARGPRGHPGNPGIPGIRGEAGLKGERGLRGDPGEPGTDNTVAGPKGDLGYAGLQGAMGEDGQPGEGGGDGNPGPDGRRGPSGEKGAPGEPGAPGLPGSPGAAGPQGSRGDNGERGPKGTPGFPGPRGEPGAVGDPGKAGNRGANGQKGQPGDPGAKGASGSQGPRGLPGQDGKDGYGPSGPPGVKGDPGFPGNPGVLGEDGQRGTKGYPGRKGNHGRGGNSGRPGELGVSGDPGHPGHRGPRGPPGGSDMSECQLVTYIRDNCACCAGQSLCPAYPTQLVFGLDMSEDVTPASFERQRSALLSLLEDITISESNCPTGARVAVVGYSAYTKYLIRFQDYHRKKQLIEVVKNIALERTANRRQLGAAMRFVGQNVFKRVRAGVMMRKVAVFLSNGPSEDVEDIVTAVMEYRGQDIVPAVISLRNAPAVRRAMEVDDTGNYVFTVLGRVQDMAADLRKVHNCAICYDPCKRSEECAVIQKPEPPQQVDVDLVMVADSSREMQADEFTGVQQLLGSVVDQLAVSQSPHQAGKQARVAVVQQSGTQIPKVEFGLQTYQDRDLMRSQIQKMQQQGGSSALGQTLEFTLQEVLLNVSQPRRRKALLVVVGTETASVDRAKLQYISQKAKCEGVALFVVVVGDRYSRTQGEELA